MKAIPGVRITLLVDNRARPGLRAEHGFAVWIESQDLRILFDTGSSDAVAENAAKMGIDLLTADLLVLSHGHYDHTGYVAELLRRHPRIQVLMHPNATQRRFSIHAGQPPKDISMPSEAAKALAALPAGQLLLTETPHVIEPWIGTSGTIPRKHSLEDTGGPFFLDSAGRAPDSIDDDLALWITTPRGLVVLTGCCHAGLINTVDQIRTQTGAMPIYAIIGGLHLKNAPESRLQATLDALNAWNPDYLIPCHCAGAQATTFFQHRMGSRAKPGRAGMQLEINPQITLLRM